MRGVWQPLGAIAVVGVQIALALGAGGRDVLRLALSQSVIFVVLVIMVWKGSVRSVSIAPPLLAMTAVVAVSSLWTVRLDSSLQELLLWAMYLGVALIVASTLTTVSAARRFLDALVVIAGWLCLIAAFTFWGAGDPRLRWYSTFYWPNPFAAFLLLVLPLSLVRFLYAPRRRDALAHGGIALLLLVSLIFTYSRGAWIALSVALPLGLIVLRPIRWRVALGRLAMLGAVVGVLAFALSLGAAGQGTGHEIATRARSVANLSDYAIEGRLNFWQAGLHIFVDHPFLGTGAGTFGAVHAAYQRDVRYYARDPHSLYVQTAAEDGVAGLGALASILAALAATWRSALRTWRDTDSYPLIAGIGLGLAAFFVHSGLDMDWMFPANPAMAMAMAGTLAWFATERASDQVALRQTIGRWPRVAVIAALLIAIVLTEATQIAQRQFLSGEDLAREGRWADASDRYAQAVRLDPWNPKFLAAHAATLSRTRPPRYDPAEASLRRAIAVDRMSALYPIELASLLLNRPDAGPAQVAEAEGLLTRALAVDPWNRPGAYRMLAQLYLREERAGDAELLYRQVVPRYLGKGLGNPTAIYTFLWPEVTDLVLDAADLEVRRGDLALAVLWLRGVLAEDPKAVTTALRLSGLYLNLGRVADARAVLEATAAQAPDNAEIRNALLRLR